MDRYRIVYYCRKDLAQIHGRHSGCMDACNNACRTGLLYFVNFALVDLIIISVSVFEIAGIQYLLVEVVSNIDTSTQSCVVYYLPVPNASIFDLERSPIPSFWIRGGS